MTIRKYKKLLKKINLLELDASTIVESSVLIKSERIESREKLLEDYMLGVCRQTKELNTKAQKLLHKLNPMQKKRAAAYSLALLRSAWSG